MEQLLLFEELHMNNKNSFIYNSQNNLFKNSSEKLLKLPWNYKDLLFTSNPRSNNTKINSNSILNKSIIQLFTHLDDESISSILDNDTIQVSHLYLTNEEQEFIDKIKLYKEDPLFLLLLLSLNYLFSNDIPKSLFNKLLTSLPLFNKKSFFFEKNFDQMILSEDLIFNENELTWLFYYPINILPDFENIYRKFLKMGIENWNDVACLTEKKIILNQQLSHDTIRFLIDFWNYKFEIYQLRSSFNEGYSIDNYKDFNILIDLFINEIITDIRDKEIITKRLGFYDQEKWTLEKLGIEYNLTRERVRQIEKKYLPRLKRKSKEVLNRFWFSLETYLYTHGGCTTVDEIIQFFKKIWDWENLPEKNIIMSLVSFSNRFIIQYDYPEIISVTTHSCLDCNYLQLYLKQEFEFIKDGMLHAVDLLIEFKKSCYKNCSLKKEIIPNFSIAYLIFAFYKTEDYKIEDDIVYTYQSWILNCLKKRTVVIEHVFLKNKRAMHYNDVHLEILNSGIQIKNLSSKNIYSVIGRMEELYLWDKGTYIHKDHFVIPTILIHNIESFIVNCFKDDIPFISITGIFLKFQHELKNNNIPTEYALYSILKRVSKELLLNDFPYINLKSRSDKRSFVYSFLEEFIKEKATWISKSEIKDYGINKLFLSENIFNNSIPNIIHYDRGKYIHIDNVQVEAIDLLPIVNYIRSQLEKNEHISIEKIFKDKKVTCKLLSINSTHFLYSLLNYYFNDEFNFSKFPSIYRNDDEDSENTIKSFTNEIEMFIRNKKNICSYSELHAHFIDNLGYSIISLYSTLKTKRNIIKYTEGAYLHIDNLDWSNEKEKKIIQLCDTHLNERKLQGEYFGLVSYIYDFCYESLPKLPNQIIWTPTLLKEIIIINGKYKIIGSQNNAFVQISNENNITTLSELLYLKLKKEFNGAAKLADFAKAMSDCGILSKSLTLSMLGDEKKIVIENDIIRLAEIF